MTFSISARCPSSGMFGVAVSSSSPAVAARCAHARAGVGAVATQNVTDPRLAHDALDLMALGSGAQQAIDVLVARRPFIAYRQLAAVDSRGESAAYSGEQTLGVNGICKGDGAVAAGNLLADGSVPERMIEAFQNTPGHLGDRLLAAMEAARAAGGEVGPVHSAGLVLVHETPWPLADLRVDWHETDPLGALSEVWRIYQPQMHDYVQRALDPTRAPSYGVPGDE